LSWQLDGNFWEHEYSMTDGMQTIMSLSKKFFTWGDSYELDMSDSTNELLCLCVTLAVDCVLEAQSSAQS